MTETAYETVDSPAGGGAGDPGRADWLRDAAAQPAPKGGSCKSSMARANVMMAGLLAAGGVVVYVLSLRGGPAKASAEERQANARVESALLRIGSMAGKGVPARGPGDLTRSLMEDFHDRTVRCQVPPAQLRKDPFVVVRPRTVEVLPSVTPTRPAAAPSPAPNQADSDRQFQSLRLQSVMKGGDGTIYAIVSNNLLTVGQKIDGFTLESVDLAAQSVVFSRGTATYTLKMSR